jgi:hypothetical protein
MVFFFFGYFQLNCSRLAHELHLWPRLVKDWISLPLAIENMLPNLPLPTSNAFGASSFAARGAPNFLAICDSAISNSQSATNNPPVGKAGSTSPQKLVGKAPGPRTSNLTGSGNETLASAGIASTLLPRPQAPIIVPAIPPDPSLPLSSPQSAHVSLETRPQISSNLQPASALTNSMPTTIESLAGFTPTATKSGTSQPIAAKQNNGTVIAQSDAPAQRQDVTLQNANPQPEAKSAENGQDAVAPMIVHAKQTDETSSSTLETVGSVPGLTSALAGSIVPSQPLDGEAINDVSVTVVSELGSRQSSVSQITVATDSTDASNPNQTETSANPPVGPSSTDQSSTGLHDDAPTQDTPIVEIASAIEIQQASQDAPVVPRTSRTSHPEAIKPNSNIGGNLQTTLRTGATGTLSQSSTGQISNVPLPDILALHLSQSANSATDLPALAQAIPTQKNSVNEAGQITDTANHAPTGTDNRASATSGTANAVTVRDSHTSAPGGGAACASSDPNPSPNSGPNSPPVPAVTTLQNPAIPSDSSPASALAVSAMPSTPGQTAPSSSGTKADSGNPAPPLDANANPLPGGVSPSLSAGPVQMAQIVSKTAQSEMRIGLNTASFGSVEIRTVVQANDVGVVIGSEKGDLHSLMTNELPGIASTLQQQNLRLNQVNFHQGFAFSGNSSSGGGDSQPRYFAAARTLPPVPPDFGGDDSCAASMENMSDSSTGLNILA